MPTPSSSQLLAQLVALTEAVKDLAERDCEQPDAAESRSEADRVRQRVAFGYQVLGALTGRVSSGTGREFDVRAVSGTRFSKKILFEGLPPGADWAELRSGKKIELLRIKDPDDGGTDVEDAEKTPRRESEEGIVRPELFADADPIGSIVFLRSRRGPVIAFGPRLGRVSSAKTVANSV
jgi:hypothetical protein